MARASFTATAVGPRSVVLRYGFAAALAAGFVLVTAAVPVLIIGAPFLASVVAVLVAGLVAGIGPAIFALALTTAGLGVLLPRVEMETVSLAARLATYGLVGGMVAAVAAAGRRLFERERAAAARERRAAARTARLQSITAALADCGTAAEVADVALEHGVDAAGAVAGRVSLLSDCGQELVVIAARGMPGPLAERFRRVPPEAPSWHPVTTGAALFLPDRAALTAAFPGAADLQRGIDLEAYAALPLRTPRSTLGVLSLTFGKPRAFEDEDERALLQSIADQCAQALERTRHAERERAALDRTRMLLEAAGAFADAGDLQTLFDRIAAAVARRFDAAARVELFSADEGLQGVAAFGPGAVAKEDARPVVLRTPLRVAGEVIGSISATRCGLAARPFTDDDRELLEELAARAALAIVSARRHDELVGERRRLSEVLAQAQDASRAKDEFLAMLSHELRNPLAPIVTALHLMRLRGPDAFPRERAIIERQVRHLTNLVDDLLDVSRVTQGKVRLQRRVVPLAHVVARAVEMASPLYEQREHALVVEVPHDLHVNADEHRLAQVISNLLVNAGKYTPRRGHVQVDAIRTATRIVLTVRDDGIGIPRELLGRIFELFVQGERQSDRALGGLGLGLPIVQSLVQLHGGEVRAESEGPGTGSTFTVDLPLAEPVAEPLPAPAPAPALSGAVPRRRVLVVDDNRDAAELLAEGLRDAGEVRVAYDGPGALAILEDFTPDVALLDLGLPVMDGFELARRVRALMPAVRLVAVSGYGQERDRQRSAEAGFAEHLVKPVDLTRLRALVRGDAVAAG